MLNWLPDEVFVENILLRLSIKSIIQCSCVCKSWCSLIMSPNFISTHLRNNSKTEIIGIFLQQLEQNIGRFLFLFDNQNYFRPISLHLPDHDSHRNHFVGSVNGLICISVRQGSVNGVPYFILFNPSIGCSIRLPFPPPPPPDQSSSTSTLKGLGFDESTRDYKILYIVSGYCFIYSLNSNSWTKLIVPPPILKDSWFYLSHSVIFVNGAIHWFAFQHIGHQSALRFIMVFDIKSETFGRIPLPQRLSIFQPPPDIISFSMMEFGESSIAVIQRVVLVAHIWVMKEYGKVESWIKLATVDTELGSRVLGFRNKDEVLIRLWKSFGVKKCGYIVSQNINNDGLGKVKYLMDLGEDHGFSFSRVYKYVPSLVLFDKANTVNATLFAIDKIAQSHDVEQQQLELGLSKHLRKTPRCSRIYKCMSSLVLLDKTNNVNATTFAINEITPSQDVELQQLELGRSKRFRKTPTWHHS